MFSKKEIILPRLQKLVLIPHHPVLSPRVESTIAQRLCHSAAGTLPTSA